ncbi:MAG: TRAP transporter small permease, partial [Halarsenatibacteraceae bacterium]
PWVPELSRYMLIWLTLLGTVIALDKEEHVSVSFFYNKLHPTIKYILNIVKYILIGYFAYVLLTAGIQFADTRYVGTFTGVSGTIPRSILPISGGLLLMITLKKLYYAFIPTE